MISCTLDLGTLVARKTPPPPPQPDNSEPPSETARIAGDLMEMLRDIQDHIRKTQGKRPKMAQLLDSILRPVVVREHGRLARKED